MPRNKVEMKLIEDHKKRKLTFKNRSDGLIKKTEQIATLCGSDALCICCDPMAASGAGLADGGAASVKTWPADREKVQKLIRRYRDMPADRFRQVLTPLTFNEEELKKEQSLVLKVQQCGAGKLGPWDSSFDDASVADLNSVLGKLDETMQRVQQRMVALGLVRNDMIVPTSSAAVPAPMPHAMLLPDKAFSFGGILWDADSMVPQHYDLPHDHMLAQPFPFQPPCHSYQMPLPYLSYQMPPPLLSYQMPPTTLLGSTEFGETGYATNAVNRASSASEFYDDLMQGFDAGGAYVSDDVLGQAFSAGSPSTGYNLAHHATASIWPGSKQDNPIDGAAFQFPPRNDFDGPPGSASCCSSTIFQGGFQN